ncbi:unnamed protein product [Debaryomyces tyrocola]|nr:unnamed protein product [Debaryomyces tyrocola]
MSNIPLNELLHKTIKDLHTLHLYPTTQTGSNYEILLEETIQSILQLLNYHDKLYYELNLNVSPSCSDIGSLSLLYYLNKSSLGSSYDSERITNLNIFSAIQSYLNQGISNKSSRSYVLKQLVKLLSFSDSTSDDKKPKRIKESFSTILVRFSELLDFFFRLHSESEQKLVYYINRCFNYELNLYSNLQDKLDSGLNLDDHDTEKMVSLLDEFIGNRSFEEKEVNEDNRLTDTSIFSYESNEFPSHIGISASPLNFQCNDQNFSNLYQLFLQVSSFKKFQRESQSSFNDYSKYIRIMISLYKKSSNIDTMEINDFKYKELKFNYFYNFFLSGQSSQDSILPARFEEINKRVITKMVMFPELYYENRFAFNTEIDRTTSDQLMQPENHKIYSSYDELEGIDSQISDNVVGKWHNGEKKEGLWNNDDEAEQMHTQFKSFHGSYTNEDQLTLVNNLRHIIPLLNEFNFDFNINFPLILKYYMHLLYHELPEMRNQDDMDFVESIVALVDTITDYENEDVTLEEYDIRDTVLRFYQLHTYLNKESLSHEELSRTTVMKLAICEYYSNSKLKYSIFHKWNYRTLAISQLEYNLNYEWLPKSDNILMKKVLKRWFSKKLKLDKLESATTNFYDQDILCKTFKDFWLIRSKNYRELNDKAILRYETKWLNLWYQKLNYTQGLQSQALDHNKKHLLKAHFKYFLINFQKNKDLSLIAFNKYEKLLYKDNVNLKKFIIKNWYAKMNLKIEPNFSCKNEELELPTITQLDVANNLIPPSTLSEKLHRLGNVERYIIFSKYFRILKHAKNMQCIYNETRLKNNKIFLEFFFSEQWLKKTKLQIKAKYSIQEKHRTIKSNTFLHWKEYRDLNCIANSFHRSNLLKTSFKRWKLESAMTSFTFNSCDRCCLKETLTSNKLRTYFTKWLLAYQLKCFQFKSELKLKSAALKQIGDKSKVNNDNALRAIQCNISNTNFKFLVRWIFNYRKNELMNEVSDLNLQRKYLNKIIGKLHLYTKDFVSIMEDFSHDDMSGKDRLKFNDRLISLVAMRTWQLRYDSRFQNSANSKIKSFNDSMVIPNRISKYLILWVNKYNERETVVSYLDAECEKFVRTSSLRKVFLNSWVSATHRKLELNLRAAEFETRLLTKKFLVIWYDQFLHVNRYLNELSDDFISQKEFRKFRETLSNWSMKYIKNIERHHQSCELFTKRWHNVKSRSILELWIYKLRERQDEKEISGKFLVDKETSMINNQSPLAKKSLTRSMIRTNNNDDPNTSYLYTPLKPQPDRVPLTPHFTNGTAGGSPTKLQETTLRLKQERIDALRKHFGKVRATSTPRRENWRSGDNNPSLESKLLIDRNSSRFIRLSPPKYNDYKPILPPKPPNFSIAEVPLADLFLSNQGDASMSKIPSTGANDDEKSIIETAKRMRRITPIFVPIDDDIDEPRFSPVKKLKEKLKNNLIEISPTKDTDRF